MLGPDCRTDKKGTVHFTNEEISGVYLQFYHVPDPKGENDSLFGIRVVLPKEVMDKIDLAKMESGEHGDGHYTMGQLMEVAVVLCRQAQIHPNCVEVENFDGTATSVADLGLEQVLKSLMGDAEKIARQQFEEERARGMIPAGMKFEDWIEVAGPDDQSIERVLH